MRRALAIIATVAVLGLSGCAASGSGTGTSTDTGTPAPTVGNGITDPVDRTRSVVGDLNEQLGREEQRTGSADPTVP